MKSATTGRTSSDGMIPTEGRRFNLQVRARDVDGHVSPRGPQGLQQGAELDARPRPEFDHFGVRPDPVRDRLGVLLQHTHFHPSDVVLGLLADGLEQPGSVLVIEEHRRDRVRAAGSSARRMAWRNPSDPDCGVGIRTAVGTGRVERLGSTEEGMGMCGLAAAIQRSRANRTPVNCHRAVGGKKFR